MFTLEQNKKLEVFKNYFRLISNYEEFIKRDVLAILRNQGSLYRVELSNLEAICKNKSNNANTFKSYTTLSTARLYLPYSIVVISCLRRSLIIRRRHSMTIMWISAPGLRG